MKTIFSDTIEEIYKKLSSGEDGISSQTALFQLQTFGKNILPQAKKKWFKMLLSEFTSPLVFILLVAVFLMLLIPILESGTITPHDLIEPIVILGIVLFNGFLGFFQAWKAENTLEALKTLQPEFSSVIRDKKVIKVPTENLVPGDIILLSEGEKIPADIRLFEAIELKVNESLLTGESTAIYKTTHESTEDLAENVVFSGSEVISGRAKGIIYATGINTKIGKIAHMLTEIERPISPMEQKLETLSKKIGIGMIILCVIVFILSILQDISWINALFTAIALAVAAVPEGLPAVMTIALAIGVSVMARKKALVRNLKSVENLGSVTVIASDKTGTITQNKMSVEKICVFSQDNPEIIERKNFQTLFRNKKNNRLLEILANCNDAILPNIGDPTEIALLQLAEKYNVKKYSRISEVPFSSDTKWMSTTHEIDGEKIEFIKGAPEVVLFQCKKQIQKTIAEYSKQFAKEGLRTLALAYKKHGQEIAKFIGIIGLQDPPRENVKQSIFLAKQAGIRTIMITGDHAITAKAIAKKVGIISEVLEGNDIEKLSTTDLQNAVKTISIFARVSPHHKVEICKALQKNGEIVAMTGDGVNDAPAITQAQVGISMGNIGTSVARNASDIVLLDDDYSTIVKGVEEGRRIFNNIKKSIVFLLSTNFAEILLLLFALILKLPIPLLPIHILFINLLTDSIPALALATEDLEKDTMKKKPKPINEGFFTGTLPMILFLGTIVTIIILGLFIYSQHQNATLLQSQSITFITLSLLEIAVIIPLRTHASILSREYWQKINKWVIGSIILIYTLTIASILTPISTLLKLEAFPSKYWIFIGIGVGMVIILVEIFKKWSKKW